MESAIERIDATYAYDTSTYSIAIVSMSSLSVIFSEIGEPQPSTTTTIGFFTRDPIGFEGSEWGLYEYGESNPVTLIDGFGLTACRPVLQKGNTPPKGKDFDPYAPLQAKRGRYKGGIFWEANDGGVTLTSEIVFRGRGGNGSVSGTATVAVTCVCIDCKCKAPTAVLFSSGFGNGKIGDPLPKPGTADGKSGSQDLFFAHSVLGGVSAGDTITVWGETGWDYTARKWHSSGSRIYLDDEVTSKSKKVSFVWKCVGDCPK